MIQINPIKINNPTANNLLKLRAKVLTDTVTGNYKSYKKSITQYSEMALKHYDIVKDFQPIGIKIPIFSRAGFNIMKIIFLNLFRKKSDSEKLLREIRKNKSISNNIDKLV